MRRRMINFKRVIRAGMSTRHRSFHIGGKPAHAGFVQLTYDVGGIARAYITDDHVLLPTTAPHCMSAPSEGMRKSLMALHHAAGRGDDSRNLGNGRVF